MQISKNTSCKTLEELTVIIKKLKQKSGVLSFNFNGNDNKKDKVENYSINWVEEEEIQQKVYEEEF